MTLPAAYAWLADEMGPKMLREALKLYGTREIVGDKHNPVILSWWKELGRPYLDDETPWCGCFIGVVAKRSGKAVPGFPERAFSWANFGKREAVAMLGDVLVFRRNGGGHVGIYVGDDDTAFHVLGGNQGDAVSITRILKARLHAIRRPLYQVQPANVRAVRLSSAGALSLNEA